jgi:prepilin-type N-terminal cleavage/methylation domain-containing protein
LARFCANRAESPRTSFRQVDSFSGFPTVLRQTAKRNWGSVGNPCPTTRNAIIVEQFLLHLVSVKRLMRALRRSALPRRWLPGRRARASLRPGFTLLELMVVTTIIAILAVLGSIPLRAARERAYVTATRGELNTAMKYILMYEVENGTFPPHLLALRQYGFTPSGQIAFCSYWRVAAAGGTPAYFQLSAMHKGSRTQLEVRHPIWQNQFRETQVANLCSPLTF